MCVRIGKAIEANSFDTEGVRQAVMNLGRDSFSERLPDLEHARTLIDRSFKDGPDEKFISIDNQSVMTRGEIVRFLHGPENLELRKGLCTQIESWLNGMFTLFHEIDGTLKAWTSFIRISETHLWDQGGFTVEVNDYLNPKWILWVAYLGKCRVVVQKGILLVQLPGTEKLDEYPNINGLSTDRNGLISLNFKSLAQINGHYDELEHGYKEHTLGRLLPGLKLQD